MGGNMRLRNKKTGEVVDAVNMTVSTPCEPVLGYEASDQIGEYASLAELNEDWEDYKPAEPLIKDEKIRKAVRAWAEANGQEKLLVIKMAGRLEISDGSPHLIYISFHADEETMDNLNDRTYYTLAELCGEEEKEPIFGYDKEHIEFAKRLMSEGITPHDLKEHYHDFEWVAKTLKDDLDKKLDQAVKNAIGGVDNLGDEE